MSEKILVSKYVAYVRRNLQPITEWPQEGIGWVPNALPRTKKTGNRTADGGLTHSGYDNDGRDACEDDIMAWWEGSQNTTQDCNEKHGCDRDDLLYYDPFATTQTNDESSDLYETATGDVGVHAYGAEGNQGSSYDTGISSTDPSRDNDDDELTIWHASTNDGLLMSNEMDDGYFGDDITTYFEWRASERRIDDMFWWDRYLDVDMNKPDINHEKRNEDGIHHNNIKSMTTGGRWAVATRLLSTDGRYWMADDFDSNGKTVYNAQKLPNNSEPLLPRVTVANDMRTTTNDQTEHDKNLTNAKLVNWRECMCQIVRLMVRKSTRWRRTRVDSAMYDIVRWSTRWRDTLAITL